jgi:hypothetical protein
MANKSYRKHRHGSRKYGSRRHKRGGAGAASPASYSDAQSYMLATTGPGDQQYNNVFESSQNSTNSNAIVGLQGQKAGKRRRSRAGSKKRRGGLWGTIIDQAIVPLSILGMQQTYGRKKRGGRKTRRHRH